VLATFAYALQHCAVANAVAAAAAFRTIPRRSTTVSSMAQWSVFICGSRADPNARNGDKKNHRPSEKDEPALKAD